MNDRVVTVLDHIDNIVVSGSVFREPNNEFFALVCLRQGLDFLHRQASKCDEAARSRLNPTGDWKFFGGGNLPQFAGIPLPLLTCSHHWYAMSAYQYALLVGAIAHRQDTTRPSARLYVERVIPEVLAFRNKVAAHYAWALDDRRDNAAEQLASILPLLTFTDDHFEAAARVVAVRRSGDRSDSREIQRWSIREIHERLRQRFWPEELPASAEERTIT